MWKCSQYHLVILSSLLFVLKLWTPVLKFDYDHILICEKLFVVRIELVGVQNLLLGDCSVEGCVWFSEPMFSGVFVLWKAYLIGLLEMQLSNRMTDWTKLTERCPFYILKSLLSVLSAAGGPSCSRKCHWFSQSIALLLCKMLEVCVCVCVSLHVSHTIGGFHDNQSFSVGGVWAA